MSPDANHIHQLIFFFIKKKYKLNIISANLITAQSINIYNMFVFIIGIKFITNSQIQAMLIILSITIYTLVYFKLFIFKYKKRIKRM